MSSTKFRAIAGLILTALAAMVIANAVLSFKALLEHRRIERRNINSIILSGRVARIAYGAKDSETLALAATSARRAIDNYTLSGLEVHRDKMFSEVQEFVRIAALVYQLQNIEVPAL